MLCLSQRQLRRGEGGQVREQGRVGAGVEGVHREERRHVQALAGSQAVHRGSPRAARGAGAGGGGAGAGAGGGAGCSGSPVQVQEQGSAGGVRGLEILRMEVGEGGLGLVGHQVHPALRSSGMVGRIKVQSISRGGVQDQVGHRTAQLHSHGVPVAWTQHIYGIHKSGEQQDRGSYAGLYRSCRALRGESRCSCGVGEDSCGDEDEAAPPSRSWKSLPGMAVQPCETVSGAELQ